MTTQSYDDGMWIGNKWTTALWCFNEFIISNWVLKIIIIFSPSTIKSIKIMSNENHHHNFIWINHMFQLQTDFYLNTITIILLVIICCWLMHASNKVKHKIKPSLLGSQIKNKKMHCCFWQMEFQENFSLKF